MYVEYTPVWRTWPSEDLADSLGTSWHKYNQGWSGTLAFCAFCETNVEKNWGMKQADLEGIEFEWTQIAALAYEIDKLLLYTGLNNYNCNSTFVCIITLTFRVWIIENPFNLGALGYQW